MGLYLPIYPNLLRPLLLHLPQLLHLARLKTTNQHQHQHQHQLHLLPLRDHRHHVLTLARARCRLMKLVRIQWNVPFNP